MTGELQLDDGLIAMKSGFAWAKKKLAERGPPHLRPFNIGTDGELNLTTVYHLPPDTGRDLAEYALESGDILFNNTSSLEVVGKSATIREAMSVAYSNHITRLRISDTDVLRPAWLALCLRVLWTSQYFSTIATPWIGQAGINPTRLRRVRIPLPEVEEQDILAGRYTAAMADARAAKMIIGHVEELLDSLDLALLGELVPTLEQAD
jgi:type I restriction enzyme S subunit